MRMSALFGAKTIGFLEIYVVSARKRGVEPVRTFLRQVGGVIFRDFVRTSFMDGPLPERKSQKESSEHQAKSLANVFMQD